MPSDLAPFPYSLFLLVDEATVFATPFHIVFMMATGKASLQVAGLRSK